METYNGMTEAQLEDWASSQRSRYRQGTLSAEQISALNSIPGWTWDFKSASRLPFEEARAFARSLGLKNQVAWTAYAKSDKKPSNIPAYPREVYANKGWVSLGDWLGTGYVYKKTFQPFGKARTFIHSLGLTNREEWEAYKRSGNRPADIPARPDRAYGGVWLGWGDWFGTNYVSTHARAFLPFAQARAFAQSLGLKEQKAWQVYSKSNRPNNVPSSPYQAYADQGWVSWGDWLGTNNYKRKPRKTRRTP